MESSASHSSRLIKRAVPLMLLLLVAAVFVNFDTIREVAGGERTLKGVVYGVTQGAREELAGFVVPPDMGSEDALVEVEVFLRGGDPCHIGSALVGESLGTLDPDRIRITFQDTSKPKALERFMEVKLGCDQGMAINGETKFEVTTPDETGVLKDRVMYLTGDGGWGPAELHAILDNALKASYDGQGLPMDAEQFEQALRAAQEQAQERHEQEGELRREAEQGG